MARLASVMMRSASTCVVGLDGAGHAVAEVLVEQADGDGSAAPSSPPRPG